jgi:hypothetical protein
MGPLRTGAVEESYADPLLKSVKEDLAPFLRARTPPPAAGGYGSMERRRSTAR